LNKNNIDFDMWHVFGLTRVHFKNSKNLNKN